MAAPDDAAARMACADALTDLVELREIIADPILWGGQPADIAVADVPEKAHLTHLNPRVWRRMYLSTFMFDGAPTKVEKHGKYSVLRMPVHFRNLLDSGEYPYPFWHSEKKWKSYETVIEILLFFENGKLVAGSRSANVDLSRNQVPRVWDGVWTWDGGSEPRAALYQFMFSSVNPFVAELETAYRDLEDGMREQNCISCHDPANASMMKQLELLNYPNQALSGRHDIVRMLEENLMPPGVGVGDTVVRLELQRLANHFATVGDQALAFEGENIQ